MTMEAPFFAALSALLLLTGAPPTTGLCILKHNATLAECHHLDDIKHTEASEIKSLKVTSVGRHLSADVFGSITTLQHLDLSNGQLRRIEPGTFARLRHLRTIDLSNNTLTHLSRGTFEGPDHLRVLNLRQNLLTQIPIDAVELDDLKFLELSYNKLQCSCKSLKIRDELLSRGVIIPKKTLCSGPGNVKGHLLTEPDTEVICMLEKQDNEPGMQRDQAVAEGSGGEFGSGDPFDELEAEDIPEDNEKPTESFEKTEGPTDSTVGIPLTTARESLTKNDELFFSGEEKRSSTISPTRAIETTALPEKRETTPDVLMEGSGSDDLDEGSGLEASGIPMVPPITWNDVRVDEEATPETASSSPTTTTSSGGLFDFFSGLLWSREDPTTPAPPAASTAKEFDPEDEGFIGVSSTAEPPEKPADEDVIAPVFVKPVEGETRPTDETKARILDESKSHEVKDESVAIGGVEGADASAAKESKKGMGSYVVLGVLLGVLGALIGVAAYKGDFCRRARKRAARQPDGNDAENGTELKDLRKSLLDKSGSAQPKVSSNGGKTETAPLVAAAIPEEIKSDDEPSAKYVGAVSESADPIKPPRKSFSPSEEGRRNGTNGKILGADDANKDHLVNGKVDRDSLSSAGETPSSGTVSNPRESNPAPASPSAQKVKITLQDNPDSVPKTPLLITRTKAGENLVKTP